MLSPKGDVVEVPLSRRPVDAGSSKVSSIIMVEDLGHEDFASNGFSYWPNNLVDQATKNLGPAEYNGASPRGSKVSLLMDSLVSTTTRFSFFLDVVILVHG